jgi:Lar family restriction alleviation protein
MEANEPLPCPFCAHERIEVRELVVSGTRVFVVVCPECNAVGPASPAGDGREDALFRWNLRFGDH